MRRQVSMVTEPNMVPMIDVLLVLLIIFFLAAVEIVRKAFDLQLPDPTPVAGGAPPLVLSVTQGPTYTINGQPLSSTSLEGELEAIFRSRPEKILHVRAERTLRYQQVADVFSAVRGAGVKVTAIVPGTRGVP